MRQLAHRFRISSKSCGHLLETQLTDRTYQRGDFNAYTAVIVNAAVIAARNNLGGIQIAAVMKSFF